MKKFFVGCLCCFLTALAYGATWEKAVPGNGVIAWMDADRLPSLGGGVKVWLRWDYANPQPLPQVTMRQGTYQSILVLTKFNCDERTFQTYQYVYYEMPEAKGDSEASVNDNSFMFQNIVPGTMMESVSNYVCKRF